MIKISLALEDEETNRTHSSTAAPELSRLYLDIRREVDSGTLLSEMAQLSAILVKQPLPCPFPQPPRIHGPPTEGLCELC